MEIPGKHVQKGALETPRKDKEVLQPEFSSSQSLQDPLDVGRKDPDQMISMRKEDFEKLVMERSQQLAKERERGIPDPDPITGLSRDHDVHKRMGKKGVPGDPEQEDEAESRTPPPRPRSPERVGLWVEGLGIPVTRVPLGDNLQELSEQIELATKKLEEMKRRGDVTSALQKRGSPFCEEILMEVNTIQGPPITFDQADLQGLDPEHNDPMVITMDVANFVMQKVLVDSGISVDVIALSVLRRMDLGITSIKPVGTPLTGFGGHEVVPLGTIDLLTSLGEEPCRRTFMIKYLVVEAPFAYNIILGRPGLNQFQAVVSTFHLKIKFPTKFGVGEVRGNQQMARECYNLSLKKSEVKETALEPMKQMCGGGSSSSKKSRSEDYRIEPVEEYIAVQLDPNDPTKTTRIGSQMTQSQELMMIEFTKRIVMCLRGSHRTGRRKKGSPKDPLARKRDLKDPTSPQGDTKRSPKSQRRSQDLSTLCKRKKGSPEDHLAHKLDHKDPTSSQRDTERSPKSQEILTRGMRSEDLETAHRVEDP
ncbi:hypothetical protein DH2020_021164 [Rehmannia glutinosa]|uniref:Uncharacterized protein n=1 Tax=Rehmannia glutinosa TaxID=99300 RepID=A0ABR0WDE5_REHGL